jgi:hypothetical protein
MIPRPVYEVLPVVYIAFGLAGMTYSDSTLLTASTLLLAGTGVVILWLRRNYRLAHRRAVERRLG